MKEALLRYFAIDVKGLSFLTVTSEILFDEADVDNAGQAVVEYILSMDCIDKTLFR